MDSPPHPGAGAARPPHWYIHVPFCGRRCSYCDFAIAVRREVPVRAFIDAIMAEAATRGLQVPIGLRTLYLGGGTPSKLGGAGLAKLVERLLSSGVVDFSTTPLSDVEITVEANPEDVTAEHAAAWVGAGVNRVSLGVQSFDPAVLEWMHRGHGVHAASGAVEVLRDAGIANISLDLIFALPGGLPRDWARDLELALALDPSHVSLYGLTVEPGTPLGRWHARGLQVEAPEERYAEEFLMAHECLGAAGFEHYEVSNFAKPGRRSRHNSAYWSGASYAGLGPSAHSFDGTTRRWNVREYRDWDRRAAAAEDPLDGQEVLTEELRWIERVYLGLRTDAGLPIATAESHGNRENVDMMVTSWIREGWATMRDEVICLTPSGWLRLDSLVAALTSLGSRS